jgi:hypothetical protein
MNGAHTSSFRKTAFRKAPNTRDITVSVLSQHYLASQLPDVAQPMFGITRTLAEAFFVLDLGFSEFAHQGFARFRSCSSLSEISADGFLLDAQSATAQLGFEHGGLTSRIG